MISTGQFPVKEFVVYLTIYNNEINNLVSDFRNMGLAPCDFIFMEAEYRETVIDMKNWIDIQQNTLTPYKGLYLFQVLGDNHILYELYKYDQGEPLDKYFIGEYEHTDGYCFVRPYKYCFIPEYDSWASKGEGGLFIVAYGGGTDETPFGHLSTYDPLYKKDSSTPNAINYTIEYGEVTIKDYLGYIQIPFA